MLLLHRHRSTWSQATGYLPINLGTKDLDEYKAFVEKSPAVAIALEQFESSNPMVQEPVMMMQGSIDSVIKDASTYLCERKHERRRSNKTT